MKKSYLVLLPLILFFTACGKPTTALNYFDADIEMSNAIPFTKKADLVVEDNVEAIVFASYLNRIDEKYNSEEKDNFLIGVHLTNPEEKYSIFNDYSVKLNGVKPSNINELEDSKAVLKNISLKNKWAKYYIISFNAEKNIKNLNITFVHSKFGWVLLSFEK